jgi:hypothetical protein
MKCLEDKYEEIVNYLEDYPDNFSTRSKTIRAKYSEGGIRAVHAELLTKFIASRANKRPSMPTTTPDEAVSLVMNVFYDKPEADLERIKIEHQQSMSSENIIGELLERYLASVLEVHGWVWCSGEFVTAIDFIKRTADGWTELQVKNRDNTENSSSSKVRNGTSIKKWFRSFSMKSEFNWAQFPDEEMRKLLSEEGFRKYVRQYIKDVK